MTTSLPVSRAHVSTYCHSCVSRNITMIRRATNNKPPALPKRPKVHRAPLNALNQRLASPALPRVRRFKKPAAKSAKTLPVIDEEVEAAFPGNLANGRNVKRGGEGLLEG